MKRVKFNSLPIGSWFIEGWFKYYKYSKTFAYLEGRENAPESFLDQCSVLIPDENETLEDVLKQSCEIIDSGYMVGRSGKIIKNKNYNFMAKWMIK